MNRKFDCQAETLASSQHGIVMTEYTVGTALLMLALFSPMPGFGVSVFEFIIDTLVKFQANTTYLISLP